MKVYLTESQTSKATSVFSALDPTSRLKCYLQIYFFDYERNIWILFNREVMP